MPESDGFHVQLRKLKAKDNDTYNSYAFLCSVISPVRSNNDLKTDADIESCDWVAIFQAAMNGLVAPLLYSCIQKKKLETLLPEDFVDALAAVYQANLTRNQQHRVILLDAISVLNEKGIKPILLKGAHALVQKLPNADTRIISDIDILVLQPDTERARQTLLGAGFYHFSNNEELNSSIKHHHFPPLAHSSGLGYIELHQFPNATKKHPDLIADCFNTNNLLLMNLDGGHFFVNTPQQLLIYNQIHHHHSALETYRLDIRQVVEQAYLCEQIGPSGMQNVIQYINQFAPKSQQMFYMQVCLLNLLFGLRVENLSIDEKNMSHANEVVRLLLANPFSLCKRRVKASLSILTYALHKLVDFEWVKNRIFDASWYKRTAKTTFYLIRRGYIIRE